MFKIRKLNHRPWPVTVTALECDEATGEVLAIEQKFIAHFKPFSESEFMKIRDAAQASVPLPEGVDVDSPPMEITLARNAALFARIICGWGPEVTDESGQPVPYSTEALSELVTGPDGIAFSAGLSQALMEVRFGIAPAKNSKTSPMPGQMPGEVMGETKSVTT